MAAKHNLTGLVFGKLTVLGLATDRKRRSWVCQCSCGNITYPTTADLNSGKALGCRNCAVLKHGATKLGGFRTPTYSSWMSMRDRCRNPNATSYHRYGGRGISVTERWEVFQNFLADMGERPSLDYWIDRIDGDGNYEPSNCRWATIPEQTARGRRQHNPASVEGRNRGSDGRFTQ